MGHYDDFYEAEEEKYRCSPAGKAAAKAEAHFAALEKRIAKRFPELHEYIDLLLERRTRLL